MREVLKYEYDIPKKPLGDVLEEICTLPHAEIYDNCITSNLILNLLKFSLSQSDSVAIMIRAKAF